jgi:SAM-dependent methyltransferase
MEIHTQQIEMWESVEIQRSASEAGKQDASTLRLPDAILNRYRSPSAKTVFPLEYAYFLLGDVSGKTVVDYGCGAGENSALISAHGGSVIGVDISPELLELAKVRMSLHGFEDKADFRVGSAHDLPLEDNSVDVVFGMAILHHLDLEISSKEVFRVLKSGGRAIFKEPVRNSKAVKFVRDMIPYQSPDISPYERPLTEKELLKFGKEFTGYRSRAFGLPFINLAETVGITGSLENALYRIDGSILKKMKFLRPYGSVQVIEITKP